MVTMTRFDLSSKLWWSPVRLPLLGIITPTLNYIPTHRWQSNSQYNHRRLPNGAYEQPWRRHQILWPFPPVVLLEYLQRVFYNTNYHMLPGGAHGLTWRRLKILCPQIFLRSLEKQQTALDPAITVDLLFFEIHVVDYLFLPNFYRDLTLSNTNVFFSVPSTIFQIFPSIGDNFVFFVYLQTPLFRENLRPILPPRLYYFQYYHPFNLLELLSIPELCISILFLKKTKNPILSWATNKCPWSD